MCAHTKLRHEGNFILSFTQPRVPHLRHLHGFTFNRRFLLLVPTWRHLTFFDVLQVFFCDTLINEPFSQPDTGVSRALPAPDHGSSITFQFPLHMVPATFFLSLLAVPLLYPREAPTLSC